MRLAWITDVHFNFLAAEEVAELYAQIRDAQADAVLLTGDVAEAKSVVGALADLDTALARPIYFVLGNHDFYFGSIRGVRQAVRDLCRERPNLHYLTGADPIDLTPGVALVGHDGWADARLGDYERSMVMMNDYRLIDELARMNKQDRWPVLKALGDEAAAELARVLPAAFNCHREVYVATHVPPLLEACWHEGRLSDDEWAPHFTCKAVGDLLLRTMQSHSDRRMTVFCGHTHSPGHVKPLPNLEILTGGAKYGVPQIQRVWDVG
jgi:3',5'-cyclic AMP phosphodiesterase CpdA